MIEDGPEAYVTGPGGLPIEQVTETGSVRYYSHDQLGSTTALTDQNGLTVATYGYDAYGNPTGAPPAIQQPFGYAGQYTDSDTGLQYLRARYYDPATAQFLTRDPLEEETRQPYGYAADSPPNATDPTGLDFLGDLARGGINLIAGAGDTLTFGATRAIRRAIGDDNVDYCSGAYGYGGDAGLAVGALIPGEGEVETAAEGARFVVDAAGETTVFVHAGDDALEVSQHAALRITQRSLTVDQVEGVVNTAQPFRYYHGGSWKTGYYDPVSRVFVGRAGNTITTVIKNASPQYNDNLKGAQP